jgi:hypothetical protein
LSAGFYPNYKKKKRGLISLSLSLLSFSLPVWPQQQQQQRSSRDLDEKINYVMHNSKAMVNLVLLLLSTLEPFHCLERLFVLCFG